MVSKVGHVTGLGVVLICGETSIFFELSRVKNGNEKLALGLCKAICLGQMICHIKFNIFTSDCRLYHALECCYNLLFVHEYRRYRHIIPLRSYWHRTNEGEFSIFTKCEIWCRSFPDRSVVLEKCRRSDNFKLENRASSRNHHLADFSDLRNRCRFDTQTLSWGLFS